KTIIVVIGDHGEIFGSHGRLIRLGRARGALYDEVIHIPFIIKHPYIKKGIKIDSLVEAIDVAPTILDFLSIPISNEAQGNSLLPSISGSNESLHEYVFSGGKFFGIINMDLFPHRTLNSAIRSKQWKLIFERSKDGQVNSLELYNIEKDPNERLNLIADRPEVARMLKNKLIEWEDYTIKVNDLKKINLTDDELRAAREAGYFD
ncbi:MAG: sulfatase/phosphatase domain-containing protein, partial [Patescibacteria group bacterium]